MSTGTAAAPALENQAALLVDPVAAPAAIPAAEPAAAHTVTTTDHTSGTPQSAAPLVHTVQHTEAHNPHATHTPHAQHPHTTVIPETGIPTAFSLTHHFLGAAEHSARLRADLKQALTDAQFTNFTINDVSQDAMNQRGFSHTLKVDFADNGNYAGQVPAMAAATAIFNGFLVGEQRKNQISGVNPDSIKLQLGNTHITGTPPTTTAPGSGTTTWTETVANRAAQQAPGISITG